MNNPEISRRAFLKSALAAGSGALLTACGIETPKSNTEAASLPTSTPEATLVPNPIPTELQLTPTQTVDQIPNTPNNPEIQAYLTIDNLDFSKERPFLIEFDNPEIDDIEAVSLPFSASEQDNLSRFDPKDNTALAITTYDNIFNINRSIVLFLHSGVLSGQALDAEQLRSILDDQIINGEPLSLGSREITITINGQAKRFQIGPIDYIPHEQVEEFSQNAHEILKYQLEHSPNPEVYQSLSEKPGILLVFCGHAPTRNPADWYIYSRFVIPLIQS